MAGEIKISNRFKSLYDEFKTDTGLVAKDNLEVYIPYFNARMNDVTNQILQGFVELELNKIDFLPGQIRLQMAEMIRSHEVIKDLVSSLKTRP
jgi:hypothetical protein